MQTGQAVLAALALGLVALLVLAQVLHFIF